MAFWALLLCRNTGEGRPTEKAVYGLGRYIELVFRGFQRVILGAVKSLS